MARLPLEGVRVIDAGALIAVPHSIKLLADMGAEVIKVESFRHPTNRSGHFPDNKPGKRWWTQSGYTAEFNRNRRSLALDISTPQGKDIFRELVKVSDIVAENYSPPTMRKLGLEYDALSKLNPGIIMLSSSAYGHTGPWGTYTGSGPTVEPTAGLSHLTGYPDDQPTRSVIPYSDNPAGVSGAFAILVALYERRRSGLGQWIDLSQYENLVTMLGEQLLGYAVTGRSPSRMGNRDSSMAPHGCFRCAGSDNWVVIAVGTDQEFAALAKVMGQPQLAADSRFSSVLSRYQHQNELDAAIEAWTRPQDHYQVFHALQAAGVPAAPVLNNKEILLDPHLKEREMFIPLTFDPGAENVGTRVHRNLAWKLTKTPGSVRMAAPWLGQHNREILSTILGLSDPEIDRLEAEQIVSAEYLGGPLATEPQSLEWLKESGRIEDYDPNYMEILGLGRAQERALEPVASPSP